MCHVCRYSAGLKSSFVCFSQINLDVRNCFMVKNLKICLTKKGITSTETRHYEPQTSQPGPFVELFVLT